MTKKDFIELANAIQDHNRFASNGYGETAFTSDQLHTIAKFCKCMNAQFMEDRWLGYIQGTNRPNVGRI
jgi:hypothetical protein